MHTFRLTANVTFQAEDIDDAFTRLAQYFNGLSDDGNECPQSPFDSGDIRVARANVPDDTEEYKNIFPQVPDPVAAHPST